MRRTALFTAAGLVAAVSVGASQVPVGPPPPGGNMLLPPAATPTPESASPRSGVPPVPGEVRLPTEPPVSGRIPPLPAPATPPEQTVEQLLDALERLKAQKATLDKQEQAVKDALAKKLATQGERLKKLGVGEKKTEPVSPALPKAGSVEDGPVSAK
jgi:hypothetical protein